MTKILIAQALNDYAEKYSTPETPQLAALNRETYLKVHSPVMLSGHLQGGFLQMVSHMVKPRHILEIGTYTGYSAICLAQGLAEGGHLDTIDVNEELEDISFRYFRAAGVEHKITQHIGDARQIIPSLDKTYDLVFIDADKAGYNLYYDLVFDKVPVGGFILADNVLYEGDVLLPHEQQGKKAKAMHAFNEKVNADPRVERLLLPLRDGIMIMRKIAV